MNTRGMNLAAALALLAGAASIPAYGGRKLADVWGGGGGGTPVGGRPTGGSNARCKRAALKRRNVLRNRRAHRG